MRRLAWLITLMAAPTLAAPGRNLVDPARWGVISPTPDGLVREVVAAEGAPGGNQQAIRLTVKQAVDPYWTVMILQEFSDPVLEGAQVRLRFWGRSRTANPVRAIVEQASPPYTPIAALSPTLGPNWKRYEVTGAATKTWSARGSGVRFQVGHQAGVLELAGIEVEVVGMDATVESARKALEPAEIARRIDKVRKGDLQVSILDANGKPVPNARVEVRMKRHAFLFGCNIFMLDPASADPIQKRYQDRFTALFNYATLPFYWAGFEPVKGRPDYARLEAMARWCRDHNLVTKGHTLVWHETWPTWAPADPDEARSLIQQRISDLVVRYRDLVTYWDVQNEANNSADYPKTGVGAWVKRDGPAEVVATTLAWARKADQHHSTLVYNDFNTGQSNEALLELLKRRDALPDVVGIQSHMHGGPWSETQLWSVATRFSAFHRPVHFTETTVLSGPVRPVDYSNPPTGWETTPEDEAKQADYVARLYTILFSHPGVQAITWWDFADRSAWLNAPAGLLRKDLSPKPAYERLLALVRHDWWTDAQGTSGGEGTYKLRAFYGDYEITATDPQGRTATRTVSFPTGSDRLKVNLTLQ